MSISRIGDGMADQGPREEAGYDALEHYFDADEYEEQSWPCPADGHDMIDECGPGKEQWPDGRRMCACHDD